MYNMWTSTKRRKNSNMWHRKRRICKYLKLLKEQLLLIYSDNESEKIMRMVHEQINVYLQEHPSASIEELQRYVINNNDLMEYGLNNIDLAVLEKKIEYRKKIERRTSVVLIIALFFLCYSIINGIYNIICVKQNSIAYYTEEITILDETVYPDETDSTEFSSESSSESAE